MRSQWCHMVSCTISQVRCQIRPIKCMLINDLWGIRKGKKLGYQNSFIHLPRSWDPLTITHLNLVTSHTCTMIDNIAKASAMSGDTTPLPSQTTNSSRINTYATSPVRNYNKQLVVPNAPKCERRRRIPASQFSAARRNIFYFAFNEE